MGEVFCHQSRVGKLRTGGIGHAFQGVPAVTARIIWQLVQSTVLLGAIAYMLLHMTWQEDRRWPLLSPGAAADRGDWYVDEAAYRG
jgi:hypothetical protein